LPKLLSLKALKLRQLIVSLDFCSGPSSLHVRPLRPWALGYSIKKLAPRF